MAIVLLATISHAGSFNFFNENSAISEQSLSGDKLMNTKDHNRDLCQRQVDQLAKALKTCYETTPSPPLKEFVKRGKINSFVNGILFQKLFWPTVRKKCLNEREKLLKFEAEGWELAKIF